MLKQCLNWSLQEGCPPGAGLATPGIWAYTLPINWYENVLGSKSDYIFLVWWGPLVWTRKWCFFSTMMLLFYNWERFAVLHLACFGNLSIQLKQMKTFNTQTHENQAWESSSVPHFRMTLMDYHTGTKNHLIPLRPNPCPPLSTTCLSHLILIQISQSQCFSVLSWRTTTTAQLLSTPLTSFIAVPLSSTIYYGG